LDQNLFSKITGKLQKSEPILGTVRVASVAIILDGREDPKTLLIKRANRPGDPWSGQVAFPGGKAQNKDKTVRETATREAREEVGLDLDRDGDFLGYFESFRTHTGTMDVVPSVFLLRNLGEVRPNGEVSSYRWAPLRELFSPEARTVYTLSFWNETQDMPAYRVGDYIVWGLTHRILSSLIE